MKRKTTEGFGREMAELNRITRRSCSVTVRVRVVLKRTIVGDSD